MTIDYNANERQEKMVILVPYALSIPETNLTNEPDRTQPFGWE